jgi:hypothetical protein
MQEALPREPDYHLGMRRPVRPAEAEEARVLEIKSRRERAAERERGTR